MNDLTNPLGLVPRQIWLRKRVSDCVDALQGIESIEDWSKYLVTALVMAEELTYAVTEWNKYYNDNQ
jgi:hypothetical protein